MSLVEWELLLLIGDEAHHMFCAMSDLAGIWQACVHGVPNAAALVRVVSSLFLFIFHVLVITPGASTTSDLAVFFGEMHYHFFLMLLRTWQLTQYLWTVRKRNTWTFVSHWSAFVLHTGLVWLYTSVVHLSLQRHVAGDDGLDNNAAVLLPPTPRAPESPDAAAIARAVAAARDTATQQHAPPRRSPYHSSSRLPGTETPLSSPPSPLLTEVPSHAIRELGRTARRMSELSSALSSRRASALDRVAAAGAISETMPNDDLAAQEVGARPEVASGAEPQQGIESPPFEGEPASLLGSRTRTLSISSKDSWSLSPYSEGEVYVRTVSGELVAKEDSQSVVDSTPNNLVLSEKDSAFSPESTPQHDTDGPANAFHAPVVGKEQTVLRTPSRERFEADATNTGKIVPTNESAPALGGDQGAAPDTAQIRPLTTASDIGLDTVPGSSGSYAKTERNPTVVSSGAQESREALSTVEHSPVVVSAPGSRKASSTTPPKSLE